MSNDPFEILRSSRSDERRRRGAIMERVRGEYFRPPKHDETLEYIDDIIDRIVERRDPTIESDSENTHELPGLVVIGEPRAGKSTMLKRIFREHPAFPGYGVTGSGCPLVTVVPEGPCTLNRFTIDTLRQLGMPAASIPRNEDRIHHLVRDQARLMGVKIIHIDEAHHITQPANSDQIKKILNTFKCLLIHTAWPIALIFSGVPEVSHALRLTKQLSGRFSFVHLEKITISGDARKVQGVIRKLAECANLTMSDAHRSATAPRLIHAGDYQMGAAIEYAQDAVENALKRIARATPRADGTNEPVVLLPEDFARAYARRTAALAQENPFIADDWETIRPLAPLDAATGDDPFDKPRAGRSSGSKRKGS
jgi:hypothetical protein